MGGRRLELSKQLLLSLCEQANPPPGAAPGAMEGCPTPPCRAPAVPARPPALAGPPGQRAGARGVGADPLCFRASAAPTGSTWESSCSGARWRCCSVAFPAGRSSSTPSTSCCSAGRTRPCPEPAEASPHTRGRRLLSSEPWFSRRLAQEYVHAYIPALPANFLYSLLAKYLQNQGIMWPQVLSGVVGNCVNGLANYILVSVLGLGVRGSACANMVSQFTQAVFLLLCIVKKKLHLDTWAGWSSQCLQDWGPFFRLAVPSMLMTCIEWWAYEIGSFLMGLLSVLDLSAQAIIYEVATVVYMIPMGLSIAVCFRVGTALGAADTVQAKRSAVSGTLCTVGTSLVVGTVLSLLRNKLGHIFTNDEEVVALVSKVLPLYVVFHLFEAVCGGSQGVDRGSGVVSEMQRLLRDPAQCLYGGVLRGTGRQAFGAVVNAVAYYVVGLPLGAVLTFVVGLGITGTWSGGRRGPRAAIRRSHCPVSCRPLAGHAGLCLPGRRGLRHLHRLDGLEARRGGVVWNLRGVPVCDHVLLGLPGTAEAGVDSRPTGRLRLLQVQKRVGLPPQATESAAPSLRPGPERAVVSSVATGSYPGVTLTMYSRPEAHLDLFGTPEAAQPLPAPPGRLSAKQLAIRRGAALGAATGTLVVGLVIRVLAARP
ncbi:multidrug and toxin extrusion protein 2-like isoform 2-T2 [Megaptera novaeangliae]